MLDAAESPTALRHHPARERPFSVAAVLLGVVSAALALWVFYVRPWLGGHSLLDGWLDSNRCLVQALCPPELNWLHQPGLLFAILAVVLFALALDPAGRLLVADVALDEIAILPEMTAELRGEPPRPR